MTYRQKKTTLQHCLVKITPCQVKNVHLCLALDKVVFFCPQTISKMDTERSQKVCLFGENLHGKHWVDTPRCPNHCGDSPQNKPFNLGQMWGQF